METTSRTENAKKNILFGYISKITELLLPFVSRTIILYILGEQYLGLSSLFTSILNMLNMTELGFSSAVVFGLYKPLSDGDTDKVRAYMSFYKQVYKIIGIIILVMGIALLPFLHFLIKGDTPSDINLYAIYVIYLINTVVSYLAFAYKSSLLQASQKGSVVSKISSLINCSKSVFQIIALLLVKSYYVYVLLIVVATLVNNFVTNAVVNRMYPQYMGYGVLEKKERAELYTNIKGLAISKVCGVMRDSLDSITLSAFVSLSAVAIYGNYYYILSALHGLMVVVTVAIKAGVGNSICTESVEKNTNDMLKFNYFYMFIASWCFTCLICLYQDFMLVWVGDELIVDNFTMILFAFYFYSLCFSDIRNVYIEAKGMWWEYRYRSIFEACANLILNVLFVYMWGIKGVLIATILTFWSINLLYGSIIIFKQYFGFKALKSYILQNVGILVSSSVATIITYFVCYFIILDNMVLQLAIKAMACCIIPIIVFVILNMKNRYMLMFHTYIKKLFLR